MNENIKIASRITAKTFLAWSIVVFVGSIITFLCIPIVLFQVGDLGLAGGGHGSPFALVIGLFSTNICGFILFMGAPIFIGLYFTIASKIAIQSIIYQIWKNKAGSFVENKIIIITDKLTSKNDWTSFLSNETLLRVKLLEANKKDKETSKIKKKTINYLFKKIKLDDIDFTNDNLKLSDIILTKVIKSISETTKPSFCFFWLLISFQLILIICSQFSN